MTIKWHKRFLANAEMTASWSKYPGLNVGCVIVDDDKNQLSGGFNGFPRGITDDGRLKVRDTAIRMVVHAEANAIATAARNGHSLKGGNLYCTHRPCPQCASLIIQSGIKRVVTIWGQNEISNSGTDWRPEFDFGTEMLMEAGVEVYQVDRESDQIYRPEYTSMKPTRWRGWIG